MTLAPVRVLVVARSVALGDPLAIYGPKSGSAAAERPDYSYIDCAIVRPQGQDSRLEGAYKSSCAGDKFKLAQTREFNKSGPNMTIVLAEQTSNK